MPTIPIKSGVFTDVGYRYQRNFFDRLDSIWPFGEYKRISFYNLIEYNHDQYDVTHS